MMKTLWATVLTAAALGLQPATASATPWLSVTPVGGKYTNVHSLNDVGQYAVNNFGPEIPFQLASISGAPKQENVGSLGGYFSAISSINNKSEAVGASTTANGAMHAFFYSSGRLHDLTTAYGVERANAINDRGDITGQTAGQRAMVIRKGRAEVFGPANSVAGDVNEAGDILVEYFQPGQASRSAVYRAGRLNDLPTLGGAPLLGGAINDAGWVSGYGSTADGRLHAWLYDGKSITDLTPLAANGSAHDINNLGQVVGSMDNRAFLYADGRLVDLNTFVDPAADLLLTAAIDINNRGQILATSCDRAGVFCYGTMLLDHVPPVPELPQFLMLATVLLLFGVHRVHSAPGRRRRAGRRTLSSGARGGACSTSASAAPHGERARRSTARGW